MKLTLEEIKEMHEKAYSHGMDNREKSADELYFYWITQWDDELICGSTLAYKGQFDILRKAGRKIIGDLRANEVSINFEPIDESRTDGADLIDGMYRTDDRRNTTIEAYDYALQEAVVCGTGAWEMFSTYQSRRNGDSYQVIDRRYIPEANNTVFWDPASKQLDRSDARYCSIIYAYTEESYEELRKDLGLAERSEIPANFATPEDSGNFIWRCDEKSIYVATFYYRYKRKDIVYTLQSPVGDTIQLLKSDIDRLDILGELTDSGYDVLSEKKIERWAVCRYIVSGDEILEEIEIACEFIPVISTYGERAFVNGQEVYEGIVRLAKDPQRLRNFQLSYLADIVSRSPRPKPIFFPEQIQGFEDMYQENGADNNYPFYYQNRTDANGNPLPIGPVAQMPEQNVPTALLQSIELSRQSVEDVANPALPQSIADPDLSGKAVYALQGMLDQQSIVYQQNFKHAKRYDALCYASFASQIYDTPREVVLTAPDGTRTRAKVMETIIDKETGEPKVINDITNTEFDVFATIDRAYATKKSETIDNIDQTIQSLPPGSPMQQALVMKKLELMDGVQFDDVREYARKQLILTGFKKPETEEEMAMLQQAQQQGQEPSAEDKLATGELLKGQAAVMREQREAMKTQSDIQKSQADIEIDAFKAQTDRINSQINAQKVSAEIDYKRADLFSRNVERAVSSTAKLRGSARQMSAQGGGY